MMAIYARWASVGIGLLVPVAASAQGTAAELSAEQRRIVASGGQVFLTWSVPTSSWPRACVFERIAGSAEEAAAVFIDYERHRSYIPGLKKSRISRVVDDSTVEVDYTLDVPVVSDEEYTVRDRLTGSRDSARYTVEWTLVRASSTKATEGSVRFEPLGADGAAAAQTLMTYCNLVTPGSRLAKLGFIKSRAMNQVRETAHAIAVQVERERATDRALLAAQVKRLRDALSVER